MAILLNDGVLEIILPYPIMCEGVLPLCSRYSAVHSLHIRDLFRGGADRVLYGIPWRLPSLQHLDMDLFGLRDNEPVEFFQDPAATVRAQAVGSVTSNVSIHVEAMAFVCRLLELAQFPPPHSHEAGSWGRWWIQHDSAA